MVWSSDVGIGIATLTIIATVAADRSVGGGPAGASSMTVNMVFCGPGRGRCIRSGKSWESSICATVVTG